MTRIRPVLSLVTLAVALEGCTREPTGVPAALSLPLTDRIVFESDALDSQGDVFIMNIDGTDLRSLTGKDTSDFCPALSPDGNWIAFLQLTLAPGENPFITGATPSMVLMKANGTERRILNKYQSLYHSDCPVWSNDSQLVAFSSPKEPRVRATNEPIVRTYNTSGALIAQFNAGQLLYLSFSPDNTRFLYSTYLTTSGAPIDFRLESVNLDGTDVRRITPALYGDWSSDGTLIVYDTFRSSCSGQMVTSWRAICTTSPDGVERRELASSGSNPKFSPDGAQVAYACGTNLCITPTAGGEATIFPGAGEFISPVWSPDGKSVGFTCNIGSATDICLADLQSKSIRNLTSTTANESHVSFSPRSSR